MGMLTSVEIRRLGAALGVNEARHRDIGEVILSIHQVEGGMPCFSELWSSPCHIVECPFVDRCSSFDDGGDNAAE